MENAGGFKTENGSRRSDDLALQQQNLLMVEHIARLEADPGIKGRMVKDLSVEGKNVDLRYLALSMLDFIMEESAFKQGAAISEVAECGRSEALRMIPGLSHEAAGALAGRLLDHLLNAKNGQKALTVDFYDPRKGGWSFATFEYLKMVRDIEDPDSALYRLGDASRKMALGILDLSDDVMLELEERAMQKAIERGHLDDALRVAASARSRSINFRMFINERIHSAHLAPERVNWRTDVLPEIERARDHLSQCLRNDHQRIAQVNERLPELRGDPKGFRAARKLLLAIEECQAIHSQLHRELSAANDRYVAAAAAGLFARTGSVSVNPLDDLLAPLMASPLLLLSDNGDGRGADDIHSLFMRTETPRLFHFGQALDTIFKALPVATAAPPDDQEEEEIAPPAPPTHGQEQIERISAWLLDEISAAGSTTLSSLFDTAIALGWEWIDLRCLALCAIGAVDYGTDLRVQPVRKGRYAAHIPGLGGGDAKDRRRRSALCVGPHRV